MKIALIADMQPLERGTGIARYSYELCRGLRERGTDVKVLSVAPPSVPYGEAMAHAVRLPLKVLSSVRDFDLVHATAPITALPFPLVKKPKVVTYHDLISLVLDRSGTSFHTRLVAPAFFRVGKWSDRIITNSSQTKDDIKAHLGFSDAKLKVIPLGVGSEFAPSQRTKDAVFSLGFVGALVPRKRLDYLVNVFHCLKKNHSDINIRLLIYGYQGSMYRQLVRQVEILHLEGDVEFMGSIPQEKLVEAYNALDVFMLPSEWEGFGLPILEAQKCGVPVVIRRSAHIPPEVAKCALKTNSVTDASETIYDLLTNSALRKKVVEAGMKHSNQFTWEKTVSETIRVYKQLLE